MPSRLLKTVEFSVFNQRLRPALLEADNSELIRRLDTRRHIQLWTARWLTEQIGQLEAQGDMFWLNNRLELARVTQLLGHVTNRERIEPMFLINQVVGVSHPSTSSLFNIVLRVSSREVVKALLAREEDYEWVKNNYDIELTRARRSR